MRPTPHTPQLTPTRLRVCLALLFVLSITPACSFDPVTYSGPEDTNNTQPNNIANSTNNVEMSCGNGRLDPGEKCDSNCPIGPSDCDDGNYCTRERVTGKATDCTAACVIEAVTTCIGGDGCCPSSCTLDNDSDCKPIASCDGQMTDPGELCDDEDCPTPDQCFSLHSCVKAVFSGNKATCNAKCDQVPITECKSGDSCCPTGCVRENDSDCADILSTCGNGKKDAGELCDGDCIQDVSECPQAPACELTYLVGSPSSCNVACMNAPITLCMSNDSCCPTGCTFDQDNDCPQNSMLCGNGTIDPGEACDGNCPQTAQECQTSDACQIPVFLGDPANCTSRCGYSSKPCQDNDSCCPQGCNFDQDNDCGNANMCGNPIPNPLPHGPSSIVSKLNFLIGSDTCCFDFNGDNDTDNALGTLLSFATGYDPNRALADRIRQGLFAMIFEHVGLTNINAQASFSINILNGTSQCLTGPPLSAGGNVYDISNTSASSSFNTASISNFKLEAGPGELTLPLTIYGGAVIDVPLRSVRLKAEIDPMRSGANEIGVAIKDGKLGGIVKIDEMITAINNFANSSCPCLVNTNNVPVIEPDTIGYKCNKAQISSVGCSMTDPLENACDSILQDVCPLFSLPGFTRIADVDSQNVGQDCTTATSGLRCDAMSFGATLEAHGAILYSSP